MGNSNRKIGILSKIWNLIQKTGKVSTKEEEEIVETPDSFDRELEKAKIRYKNFHLTKSMQIGSEIKRKDYFIKRNSDTIYRLEGKNYQIVVVTGSSLESKEGRVNGILQITEADLNRALQREHSDLDSFLELWKPNLVSANNMNDTILSSYDWKRILEWEIFWREQLLLRLRPDTIAILLVSLDKEYQDFVMRTATKKQKKIYNDELFYLNQGKNSQDWNPYTKNKTLQEPDIALKEFIASIRIIEKRREKDNG